MITIKKGSMEFNFENDEFMSTQDSPDGMYFKFRDGSELMLHCEKTPQLKTIPTMLMNTTAKKVLLDFNNPKNLISFS